MTFQTYQTCKVFFMTFLDLEIFIVDGVFSEKFSIVISLHHFYGKTLFDGLRAEKGFAKHLLQSCKKDHLKRLRF